MLNIKHNVKVYLRCQQIYIKNNNFVSLSLDNFYWSNLMKTSSLGNTIKFSFSEKEKNDSNKYDNQDFKRYDYDFEAPEDSNFEYKSKLKKVFYFVLNFSLFSYGIYFFFLNKLNLITKKREFYLLNETFELRVSEMFSRKIQKIFEHYIYKHDIAENQIILDIYKKILEKNKIKSSHVKNSNVFIVESETLGCLMLETGDLFISSRLIDLSNNNPNHLAFFIACEVAYQAMGLNSTRIKEIVKNQKFQKIFFKENKNRSNEDLPKYTITDKKFKELEYYNRYILFYPESVVTNYFEEKEIFRLALKILNNAEFDIFDVNCLFKNLF